MSGLHEKIQLSAEDMKYLQKIFLSNAHSKLKLNLPSSSQDTKDPLTLKIIDMIEEFIYGTFEMSKHSLLVDGKDMTKSESLKNVLSKPKEQIEPFDVELNQKLRQIYQEVEKETLEVTKLRREFPLKALNEYKETLETNYDSKLQQIISKLSEEEIKEEEIDEEVIPRLQDMKDDYNEALKLLNELKQNIPLQGGEIEKLNELVKFIEDTAAI